MSIKLNFWQTIGFFSPYIIAYIIYEVTYSNINSPSKNIFISNILMVFNLSTAICYQTYLLICFINKSGIKSKSIMWNARISSIFILLYFSYVIYLTIIKITVNHHEYVPGPFKNAGLSITGWTVVIFMFHAFITFYFVNYQFVSEKIKTVSDIHKHKQLESDFLIAMRRLVKTSAWLVVISLILFMIINLI